MALDKYPFLDLLTRRLNQAGCAVGWNPDIANWDLKARRGAMSEAMLRLVIEHHGGPKRLARISAEIRPPKSTRLLMLVLAGMTAAFSFGGFRIPAGVGLFSLLVLWLALTIQAQRMERGLISICDSVAHELQTGRAHECQPAENVPAAQAAREGELA
jgi:hypothetical protein